MIVDLHTRNRDEVCRDLAALELELFGVGAWSESMVREELEAPDRTYVLDLDPASERIRGYAGFWFDGEDAELMTIGVGETYQRQGIAAAMLGYLIGRARDRHARRMLLEVRVDNRAALAMYRRFGFVRMGLRKRYYQPENVDAYTMSLALDRSRAPIDVGFTVPDAYDATQPAYGAAPGSERNIDNRDAAASRSATNAINATNKESFHE